MKFGLYMAVGADPEALEIPIPLIPVDGNTPELVILKRRETRTFIFMA